MFDTLASLLRQYAGVRQVQLRKAIAQKFDPVFKGMLDCRGVEHPKLDITPQFRGIVPPNNTHGPLERFAGQPQFTIQRDIRQTGREPIGSMVNVSLP